MSRFDERKLATPCVPWSNMAGSIGSPCGCAAESVGDWCVVEASGGQRRGYVEISSFCTSNLIWASEDTELKCHLVCWEPISGGARTSVVSVKGLQKRK